MTKIRAQSIHRIRMLKSSGAEFEIVFVIIYYVPCEMV